ncbi:hypothetical protein SAMN05216436_12218 [bacterium A37T11]|nr:hypothetical protein SAMN05216436_12218 [bacterium A37T11]
MRKLQVNQQEQQLLNDAITHWVAEELIDPETAGKIRSNIAVKGFDWQRLAQYSFWIALSCVVLAFLSIFVDKGIMRWVESLYETPDLLISAFCWVLAILFYYLGFRHKKYHPDKSFSNEAMMALGVFATATAVGYMGEVLGTKSGNYSLLFLTSIIIYAVLAVKLGSNLIWIFMLLALGIWFATETAHQSNWGFSFWGMNYPLRFTLFGVLVTALALFGQTRVKILLPFQTVSYVVGLCYLLISLWLLSIFGNYSDFQIWSSVKQWHLIGWGILSTSAALAMTIYGFKKQDLFAREFGMVFVVINVYTRYFEYFWDTMNRAIFFAILAISFFMVGRQAEKIWRGIEKK